MNLQKVIVTRLDDQRLMRSSLLDCKARCEMQAARSGSAEIGSTRHGKFGGEDRRDG